VKTDLRETVLEWIGFIWLGIGIDNSSSGPLTDSRCYLLAERPLASDGVLCSMLLVKIHVGFKTFTLNECYKIRSGDHPCQ
jgi:hypothetical protein